MPDTYSISLVHLKDENRVAVTRFLALIFQGQTPGSVDKHLALLPALLTTEADEESTALISRHLRARGAVLTVEKTPQAQKYEEYEDDAPLDVPAPAMVGLMEEMGVPIKEPVAPVAVVDRNAWSPPSPVGGIRPASQQAADRWSREKMASPTSATPGPDSDEALEEELLKRLSPVLPKPARPAAPAMLPPFAPSPLPPRPASPTPPRPARVSPTSDAGTPTRAGSLRSRAAEDEDDDDTLSPRRILVAGSPREVVPARASTTNPPASFTPLPAARARENIPAPWTPPTPPLTPSPRPARATPAAPDLPPWETASTDKSENPSLSGLFKKVWKK